MNSKKFFFKSITLINNFNIWAYFLLNLFSTLQKHLCGQDHTDYLIPTFFPLKAILGAFFHVIKEFSIHHNFQCYFKSHLVNNVYFLSSVQKFFSNPS